MSKDNFIWWLLVLSIFAFILSSHSAPPMEFGLAWAIAGGMLAVYLIGFLFASLIVGIQTLWRKHFDWARFRLVFVLAMAVFLSLSIANLLRTQ